MSKLFKIAKSAGIEWGNPHSDIVAGGKYRSAVQAQKGSLSGKERAKLRKKSKQQRKSRKRNRG